LGAHGIVVNYGPPPAAVQASAVPRGHKAMVALLNASASLSALGGGNGADGNGAELDANTGSKVPNRSSRSSRNNKGKIVNQEK
jgi:hypothetical protein